MITTDIAILDGKERELLDGSFQCERMLRRIRGIALSSIVTIVAISLFEEFGLTAAWFAAISLMILVASVIEKFAYHRTMASYESLIRKLVHRVEILEGVPLTPNDGHPTKARPAPAGARWAS